jgi:hypothetical protein
MPISATSPHSLNTTPTSFCGSCFNCLSTAAKVTSVAAAAIASVISFALLGPLPGLVVTFISGISLFSLFNVVCNGSDAPRSRATRGPTRSTSDAEDRLRRAAVREEMAALLPQLRKAADAHTHANHPAPSTAANRVEVGTGQVLSSPSSRVPTPPSTGNRVPVPRGSTPARLSHDRRYPPRTMATQPQSGILAGARLPVGTAHRPLDEMNS